MKKMIIAIGVLAMVALSGIGRAAEIEMLASGATKEALLELIPDFEKSSGHKVVATWTGSANIRKRIAAGEVYDLVVMGDKDIDSFIQQGRMVAGSRVDLMKSGVGVAVAAGAAKPDISSSEALKSAILAAKSVGYSTGPSGDHVVKMLERMGIADQVRAKLKQVPSGAAVGSIIKSGDAEIGFQQVSEFIHYPGITYVGPLPAAVQQVTVFSAGLHAGAKQPAAAKDLVRLFTSPTAATVIKFHGMEPG